MSSGPKAASSAVDLQYVELSDFSPGIHAENLSDQIGPAPDGAAVEFAPDPERRTSGCYGHPNGGLAPLPRAETTYGILPAVTDTDAANWPEGRMEQVVLATEIVTPVRGSTEWNPVSPRTHPDQIHVLWGYWHDAADDGEPSANLAWSVHNVALDGGDDEYLFYAAHAHGQGVNQTIAAAADYPFASGALFKGMSLVHYNREPTFPFLTNQILPGLTVAMTAGDTWLYQSGFEDEPSTSYPDDPRLFNINLAPLRMYGDSVFTFSEEDGVEWLGDDQFITSMLEGDFPEGLMPFGFYHQGRFCFLIDPLYGEGGYPATSATSNIVYTAPLDDEILYLADKAEWTWLDKSESGLVLFASTNASELFVVKNVGGGVVVRGDVANPTVVDLPGVASALGYGAMGCSTPVGYVYGTRNGVWAWNGGDSVNLLSGQLEGCFWAPRISTANDHKIETMPKGKFAYQYPFVYCTSDWVYDIRTKGWFKLPYLGADEHTHWEVSTSGRVYGIRGSIPAGQGEGMGAGYMHSFDPDIGNSAYTWMSHPIARVRDRQITPRQLVLKAQGVGTVTITIIGSENPETGEAESHSVTFTLASAPSTEVQVFTANVGLNVTDMSVYIEANSQNAEIPAPRVHSVVVGYQEEQSVRKVN